jgi:hypothetical protein
MMQVRPWLWTFRRKVLITIVSTYAITHDGTGLAVLAYSRQHNLSTPSSWATLFQNTAKKIWLISFIRCLFSPSFPIYMLCKQNIFDLQGEKLCANPIVYIECCSGLIKRSFSALR